MSLLNSTLHNSIDLRANIFSSVGSALFLKQCGFYRIVGRKITNLILIDKDGESVELIFLCDILFSTKPLEIY